MFLFLHQMKVKEKLNRRNSQSRLYMKVKYDSKIVKVIIFIFLFRPLEIEQMLMCKM